MNRDNILKNINIIGMISPGDKLTIINYNNYFLFEISYKHFLRPLFRTIYRDSGMKTCLYLNNLISFHLTNLLKETLDKDYIDLLKLSLQQAIEGIKCLKETYNSKFDINFSLICLNLRILSILCELSKIELSYEPLKI